MDGLSLVAWAALESVVRECVAMGAASTGSEGTAAADGGGESEIRVQEQTDRKEQSELVPTGESPSRGMTGSPNMFSGREMLASGDGNLVESIKIEDREAVERHRRVLLRNEAVARAAAMRRQQLLGQGGSLQQQQIKVVPGDRGPTEYVPKVKQGKVLTLPQDDTTARVDAEIKEPQVEGKSESNLAEAEVDDGSEDGMEWLEQAEVVDDNSSDDGDSSSDESGINEFTCTFTGCKKSFLMEANLLDHELRHYPYQCAVDNCKLRFSSQSNFDKHSRAVHNLAASSIEWWNKLKSDEALLKPPSNVEPPRAHAVYCCNDKNCSKRFQKQDDYLHHLIASKHVACFGKECNFMSFQNQSDFTEHNRVFHGGKSLKLNQQGKTFICKYKKCKHSCTTANELRAHYTQGQHIVCLEETCRFQSFTSRAQLVEHRKTEHSGKKIPTAAKIKKKKIKKTVHCKNCAFNSTSNNALAKHIASKHSIICNHTECQGNGRVFSSSDALAAHTDAKHTLYCDHPDCLTETTFYSSPTELDLHFETVHILQCYEAGCDKAYFDASSMYQHMRDRHGIYLCLEYGCEQKRFKSETALGAHSKAVHGL